jgi:hypothetical protein
VYKYRSGVYFLYTRNKIIEPQRGIFRKITSYFFDDIPQEKKMSVMLKGNEMSVMLKGNEMSVMIKENDELPIEQSN